MLRAKLGNNQWRDGGCERILRNLNSGHITIFCNCSFCVCVCDYKREITKLISALERTSIWLPVDRKHQFLFLLHPGTRLDIKRTRTQPSERSLGQLRKDGPQAIVHRRIEERLPFQNIYRHSHNSFIICWVFDAIKSARCSCKLATLIKLHTCIFFMYFKTNDF